MRVAGLAGDSFDEFTAVGRGAGRYRGMPPAREGARASDAAANLDWRSRSAPVERLWTPASSNRRRDRSPPSGGAPAPPTGPNRVRGQVSTPWVSVLGESRAASPRRQPARFGKPSDMGHTPPGPPDPVGLGENMDRIQVAFEDRPRPERRHGSGDRRWRDHALERPGVEQNGMYAHALFLIARVASSCTDSHTSIGGRSGAGRTSDVAVRRQPSRSCSWTSLSGNRSTTRRLVCGGPYAFDSAARCSSLASFGATAVNE